MTDVKDTSVEAGDNDAVGRVEHPPDRRGEGQERGEVVPGARLDVPHSKSERAIERKHHVGHRTIVEPLGSPGMTQQAECLGDLVSPSTGQNARRGLVEIEHLEAPARITNRVDRSQQAPGAASAYSV